MLNPHTRQRIPPTPTNHMKFIYNDGGKAAAGLKRNTDADRVVRPIAIATGKPYRDIYNIVKVSNHYNDQKEAGEKYIKSLNWHWTSTMQIGSGCTVHLDANELPPGQLIVRISQRLIAVINGVVHDTHDPSQYGSRRCVYGYWSKEIDAITTQHREQGTIIKAKAVAAKMDQNVELQQLSACVETGVITKKQAQQAYQDYLERKKQELRS
jgi:hypothetical protein